MLDDGTSHNSLDMSTSIRDEKARIALVHNYPYTGCTSTTHLALLRKHEGPIVVQCMLGARDSI